MAAAAPVQKLQGWTSCGSDGCVLALSVPGLTLDCSVMQVECAGAVCPHHEFTGSRHVAPGYECPQWYSPRMTDTAADVTRASCVGVILHPSKHFELIG